MEVIMERVVFHIDVNSAYLSWTAVKLLNEKNCEDIRKTEAIIGGDESKRHGVVLAASIPAKEKGVITGEPLYRARKKCPKLKVYPADYACYEEMSAALFKYLSKYSPEIERYSIDECFLEMTRTNYLYDDLLDLANQIREDIKKTFGFTVNVGVGSNKLLAKMASDLEKPNKTHHLFSDEIETKLWPMEVSKLFMIGPKTAAALRNLKIKTIGDLAKADINLLRKRFKNHAQMMWEYANGIDNSKVGGSPAKDPSISLYHTLAKDIDNLESLKKVLLSISEKIGISLRDEEKRASTVAINLKTSDFVSYSGQKTLKNSLYNSKDIYQEALKLLKKTWNQEKIRAIGIRLSSLTEDSSVQLSLFDEKTQKDKIQETVDHLNKKYKNLVIRPASLYNDNKEK